MDGRGRLSVRTARDGDRVLVEIGDNGPGIPEPAAAHVLESFFTTKRSAGAPAWGWTSAGASVVQRYHGDLRFASAPGDTRFQVLLPLVQPG
jgi:signal transduction histidine kinase